MATTEVLRYKVVVDTKDAGSNMERLSKRTKKSTGGMVGGFNNLKVAAAAALGPAFIKGLASVAAKLGPAGPIIGGLVAGAAAAWGLHKAATALTRDFAEWEVEFANVSTLVDTSIVDMEKLKEAITGLPPELGTAKELTEALYQAMSGGVEAAKAVEFVAEAAKAAKAGLTDTFTAVDAGTTILNSFGIESENVMGIYDQMFVAVKAGKTTFEELSSSIGKVAPLASKAGLSTEQLLAAVSALTTTGQKTSEVITSMKAALSNRIKPSKQAEDLASDLGVEFNAAALESKGFTKFMEDLQKATGGNTETMAKLFGSTEALNSMLFLTGEGAGKFSEILKEMGDSAGETLTAYDKQTQTLAHSQDTLENALTELSRTFGEIIAPALISVNELLTTMTVKLTEMTKWLKKMATFGETEEEQQERINKLGEDLLVTRQLESKELEKVLRLLDLMEDKEKELRDEATEGFSWKDALTNRDDINEAAAAASEQVGKELNQYLKEYGIEYELVIDEKGKLELDNLIDKLEDLQEAADEGIIVQFKGSGSDVKPLSEKAKEMGDVLKDFENDVDHMDPTLQMAFEDIAGNTLSTAISTLESELNSMFDSIIEGTFDVQNSFEDMIKAILKAIIKMLASQAIAQWLSLLGTSLGGGGGGGGDTGGAGGGGGGGPIMTAASGGPVVKDNPYIIGEKGPELFVPNRSGSIVPNNKLDGMGGGTFNNVNNITVEGSGNKEQDEKLANDISRALDQKIQMQIQQQMRPGGILNSPNKGVR